jgi:hypothetical protein
MVDMNLLPITFSLVTNKRFKVLIYNHKLALVNLFALTIRIPCDLETCKTTTIAITKLIDLNTSYTNNCKYRIGMDKISCTKQFNFCVNSNKRVSI